MPFLACGFLCNTDILKFFQKASKYLAVSPFAYNSMISAVSHFSFCWQTSSLLSRPSSRMMSGLKPFSTISVQIALTFFGQNSEEVSINSSGIMLGHLGVYEWKETGSRDVDLGNLFYLLFQVWKFLSIIWE